MVRQFTCKRVIAAMVVLLQIVVACLTPLGRPFAVAHAATGPAGSVPAGLPGHVLLGLANGPSQLSWMTGSGAPWDARYQYLTGGVNTGHGWSTWNSPAGAFALWYMQNSGASGYLPELSYYQMLQSLPANGSSEESKDYNNLNTPSTMYAYYADFKLLLDQARTYGRPVIIHVEPDLWGYMERMAGSCGRAWCVAASVASSGYPAVGGYPNNVQGFAEALLHLRDIYAPNAIMAIHASCWGSNYDVCNAPTSLSDTANHAAQDGAFLASAGINGNQAGTSSWDLIFTDTADRDAGYYQYVEGTTSRWWDPTNSVLPNFVNFRTWLAGINAATGRRIILWQTPIGNQYFDTDNNTWGHYQDNRAQYFLGDGPTYGHLTDFANAGVIGVLFGAGTNGPTVNTDGQGDGVTNPSPVSSFQCNMCNNHVSQYSDDDGGYLRIFGGTYLRSGGVPLGGGNPPPSGPLLIAGFEGSTSGFTGNGEVTGMGPSSWAPTVAQGANSLWVQYNVPSSWSEGQISRAINANLSGYSTLSVSVYAGQPTVSGTGVKVRFLVQGSDGGWYASSYQTVPTGARTTVSWNMSGVPRNPLKSVYVCWQFTSASTSTGNQIWFDALQAS